MSDESFFREINQELRQDRARYIWDRYGLMAIGAGLAIILAVGIYVAWDWWQTHQANESGDRFSQALTLANEGNTEEALASLSALEADGYGAYPVLARLRAATVQANAGDFAEAVASFDAVVADIGPSDDGELETHEGSCVPRINSAIICARWRMLPETRSSSSIRSNKRRASVD